MLVQTLKGFRDFLPQDARKRQYVQSILKEVFESYGFEPLETPALEYEELLMGKYGAEGDKLMYRFKDNGDRHVAMRYDQTVPLARVIAQYQSRLPSPFKRYQIQNVWRAENTQRGRFREFLQCDIDTVGSVSPLSDAEILAIIADSFEALGFKDFTIRINDRSVFAGLSPQAIIAIDKLKKIGREKVEEELRNTDTDPSVLDKIMKTQEPGSLQKIISAVKELGVDDKRISFDPTLARGLDYYTGIIIEIEIDGYKGGSVGGGGRYDDLIGMFSPHKIPAVGFAFGFDRIMDSLEEKSLFPKDLSTVKALVTIFSGDLLPKSIEVSYQLRAAGICTELYLDEKAKMEKQLKYADQKEIPFAIIVGPEEAEKQLVKIKNLKTREQQTVPLAELPQLLTS